MNYASGLVCACLLLPLLACKGLEKDPAESDTAKSAVPSAATAPAPPIYTTVEDLRVPGGGAFDPVGTEGRIVSYRYDDQHFELLTVKAVKLFEREGWDVDSRSRTAAGSHKLELSRLSTKVVVIVSSPEPSGTPAYITISH